MCKILCVSRSSYYLWKGSNVNGNISNRLREDLELAKEMKVIVACGRNTYGTRRIKKKLSDRGKLISRRRIGRLMRENNLECKIKNKYKAKSNSKHKLWIAPNLLEREFKIDLPNRVWVEDITYIPTNEGWLYLATVIDLYSRKVIGWSMSQNMKASLVNDALTMAIFAPKPKRGLLWHTDQGSQYRSESHRTILADHSITQSMSRRGNCYDNAVAESFFHTLKSELTHHHRFKTRDEAKSKIFEYIEVFYNRTRIHSSNNYLSPYDFEIIGNKNMNTNPKNKIMKNVS